MGAKKKTEVEFRYYELPKGQSAITLYGPNWVRVYGNEPVFLHFHNLFEIGICYEGEGDMYYEEKGIHYGPGFISLIPQNYPHTTISKENNYWEYIFFSPEQLLHSQFPDDKLFVDKMLEKINRANYFLSQDNIQMKEIVELIMRESKNSANYYNEIIHVSLLSLLFQIARLNSNEKIEYTHKGFTGIEQIEEALNYVEKHYAEDFLIEELAKECSLSETHFRRVFGECMNMTPQEYITLIRIKKSCEIINKTNHSMEYVAQQVGYEAVSTFTRNFRRIVGTTPYQFKKNSKNYEGKLLHFKVSAKPGW